MLASSSNELVVTGRPMEEVLFEMYQDRDEQRVLAHKFLDSLESAGLKKSDPRLKEMVEKLEIMKKENRESGSIETLMLDKSMFREVVKDNIVVISRALRHHFVIPDFQEFTSYIEDFYYRCKMNTGGKVANYIPQLAKYSPDLWGVSLCTVDGQRYSIGDTEVPFTIQSSGKPMNYAIALNALGAETVHKFIGQEPSGRMFNELCLDHNRKPHNPMVNAGAIVVCSLLMYLVEKDMLMSEKFDWVCNVYKGMAGGEPIGFSNATFLSEREAADRNYSIAYYMKEHKCFPKNAILKDVMDFYFQVGSC